jgi:hypothetical protein
VQNRMEALAVSYDGRAASPFWEGRNALWIFWNLPAA